MPQEVVRGAQGLGMRVLAYDPFVTAEYAEQRGVELVELERIYTDSDFITVHVPLTEKTRGLNSVMREGSGWRRRL